jgi:sigma-B regulation protein RsbU (phosphoserine phosphatase)
LKPETSETEANAMHCMEIWGGNRAEDNAIGTPGLDLWVFSEPYHADDQGGDVHYISLCGGGIITRLIIADVSGHGSAVGEFSDALRTLMRRNINKKSQKGLVRAINRQFTELAQLQRFATAIVATYLTTNDSLAICNAAHPRPIWYRAETRTWLILDHEAAESSQTAMNLPFGIDETSSYDQFIVRLGLDDRVIFYTDALTEAMAPSNTMLGEEGLLAIARGLDVSCMENLGAALLEKIREHRAGVPADDDVTVLVLHHNGGPPRKPSIAEKLDVYAKVFGLKGV